MDERASFLRNESTLAALVQQQQQQDAQFKASELLFNIICILLLSFTLLLHDCCLSLKKITDFEQSSVEKLERRRGNWYLLVMNPSRQKWF